MQKAFNLNEVEFRIINSTDSVVDLNTLLRSAYKPLAEAGWKADKPSWYNSPGVLVFGRFAVSPELQGHGLGSKMMDVLEARVKALGYAEIALDTSEKADHLIKMYEQRGYRFIEYHQWGITNYRSVVLSKTL